MKFVDEGITIDKNKGSKQFGKEKQTAGVAWL